MSKSAHESSCSIQSLKMMFWMIFKLTGFKNMDFSDFKGRPQGMVNFGGSNFYIFENSGFSAFTGKKINVIAILENLLSSREFTYCKNLIFGALELHFQIEKSKCPSTFLKISVRALHFWI